MNMNENFRNERKKLREITYVDLIIKQLTPFPGLKFHF